MKQKMQTVLYLKPMGDFCQLGDGWLFVDKLLLIQVTKFRTINSNSEIGAKHPLSILKQTNVLITNVLLIKAAILKHQITRKQILLVLIWHISWVYTLKQLLIKKS